MLGCCPKAREGRALASCKNPGSRLPSTIHACTLFLDVCETFPPRQYKSNCLLPKTDCTGNKLFRHPHSPEGLEIPSRREDQMVNFPGGPRQQQGR